MADLQLAIDIVAADLASKAITGVTSNITGLGTAAAAAGLAVAGGLAMIGASAVQAAAESQKVATQTAAVLKSTQGVAGLTADAVGELAGSLSKVIPIDDEVIQSTENVLLTFTSIGKDVFPQVTETALDMATALGTDAQGAAIQLGKAMQDPIKGAAALQRVGVNLSQAQKDLIKQMVGVGDVAGAQAVILKELQTEFGGSARAAGQTFAGQLTILQTQLGNVMETIGGALIPILSDLMDAVAPVVDAFADALPRALDSVMAAVKPVVEVIGGDLAAAFTTVKALVAAFTTDAGAMGIVIAQIRRIFGDTVADALDPFVHAFMDAIPSIKAFVGSVPGLLAQAGETIKRVWGTLQPVLGPVLATFRTLAPLLGDVAGAIGGLVGGKLSLGEFLGRLFGDVQGIGASLVQLLATWGGMLVGFLKERAPGWIAAAVQWVKDAVPALLVQLGAWLDALGAWVDGTGLPWLKVHLALWGAVLWGWVQEAVPPLLDRLGALLSAVGDWIVQTAVPQLATKLGAWSVAFVAWVGDALPKLLAQLQVLIVGVLDGIGTGGQQMDSETANKWTAAFVDWVQRDAVPALVKALPAITLALLEFVGTVSTALGQAILRLAAVFYEWVLFDVLPKLPGELAKIDAAIADWLLNTALPWAESEIPKLGAAIVQGIQSGMAAEVPVMLGWIKTNITDAIPQYIRDLLGIQSPSRVMFEIGQNIVAGLTHGIQSKLPDVNTIIGKLTGMVSTQFGAGGALSGSVSDWLTAALTITQTPLDWLSGLLQLVAAESGGDPTAVNPAPVIDPVTGVNYGHATGLLQTIPGTFAGNALPGMTDIMNPVDNAVAAIRYIKATYGSVYNTPLFTSGGEYKGYAAGGWITEPIAGVGLHSGRGYTLGEREAEYVTPRSHMGGGRGAVEQHFHAPVYIQPRTLMESYAELALLVDH